MLVRGILAAAVGSILDRQYQSNKTASDKKGKAAVNAAAMTAAMSPTQARRTYGSVGKSEAPVLYSGSRPGERLDSVPEHLDDVEGEPSAWTDIQEGGSESCNDDEDDEWDRPRYDYRRAVRLYAIVPIGSALLLLFVALLPKIIAPKPLPSSPPAIRLILSTILSAALWCLTHQLRVPLYSILHATLSGPTTALSFLCCSTWQRTAHRFSPDAAAYFAALTSIIHALVLSFLQESLRIASFAILDLHWYQPNGPPTSTRHPRAHDAAFREVWALALGWALAEVCAGVMQGYEQLALYADFGDSPSRRTSEGSSKSGDEALAGNGINNAAVFDEEAADLVRWSMPCVGLADDEDVEGAKNLTQMEIDSALVRLANVRARDELEELYGQPYIEIPVFVALLQRLDSILFSLGNTLLLSAAFLPLPPYASPLFTSASNPPLPSSSWNLRESPSHTHMLPLVPAFFIVAFVHAAMGILHVTPVLARIGLPAAAYASCIVGLGLTFAGVGVWIGLW
ncbi:hypothetical protein ACEPAH_2401 [Sanghuangporus vaninii]